MSKTKNNLKNYLTSFIYASGITFIMYITIDEFHRFQNIPSFLIFSAIIFIILLLENLIAVFARKKSIEINLNFQDEVNELWHLFYKFILPLIYYISLVAFGYYNLFNTALYLVLAVTFFTFFVLFVNTKAFFDYIKTFESKTHYVYDIIKFLTFFTLINTISNYHLNHSDLSLLLALIVGIITFTLSSLMIQRVQKLNQVSLLYPTVLGIIVSVLFFALNQLSNFNPLQISLGLLFVFYLSLAIIHHVLLNTLTRAILLEYLVIASAVFIVVFGIT